MRAIFLPIVLSLSADVFHIIWLLVQFRPNAPLWGHNTDRPDFKQLGISERQTAVRDLLA
jgi:hypothetical protein